MTSENNEYKQRRQQREEARKRREAADRKLKIRLGLAAALLVIAVAVIWIVVANSSSGEMPQTPDFSTPAESQMTEPVSTQPVQEERTRINIAVAGDLNVNTATVMAGKTPLGYDFGPVFQDVSPLLTNADVSVINFEGNLAGAPFGMENASAPQEMMQALADMGVDLVQVANSYSIRNGLLGLESTLAGVRAAGMEPLGAYASNQEFRESKGFTLRTVNGIRVAFVAFTKGMNNLGLPEGSENCVNVLYDDYATRYDVVAEDRIRSILRSVNAEEPDVTIALLHWGSEYNDEHSATQEEILELMFQYGVDAVVGTHPHRVQEIEFDQEAGTLVAYSLGDFYSDTLEAGTNYSVVLELEITRDNESRQTKVTGYTATPIYTITPQESGMQGLRVIRIQQAMQAYEIGIFNRVSEDVYNSMEYSLQRIEYRLAPKEDEE